MCGIKMNGGNDQHSSLMTMLANTIYSKHRQLIHNAQLYYEYLHLNQLKISFT